MKWDEKQDLANSFPASPCFSRDMIPGISRLSWSPWVHPKWANSCLFESICTTQPNFFSSNKENRNFNSFFHLPNHLHPSDKGKKLRREPPNNSIGSLICSQRSLNLQWREEERHPSLALCLLLLVASVGHTRWLIRYSPGRKIHLQGKGDFSLACRIWGNC